MSRKAWGSINIERALARRLEMEARKKAKEQRDSAKQAREAENRRKLGERKVEVLKGFSTVTSIKDSLVSQDLLRFIDVSQHERKLELLKSSINSAGTLKELDRLKKELRALLREWEGLTDAAAAERDRRRIIEEELKKQREKGEMLRIRLHGLKSRIGMLRNTNEAALVKELFVEMDNMVGQCEHLLASKQLAGAEEMIPRAETQLERVKNEARNRLDAWQEKRDEAESCITDFELELAELQGNPVAEGWCGGRIKELQLKLANCKRAFYSLSSPDRRSSKEFDYVIEQVNSLKAECSQVAEEAGDMEAAEARRGYAVNGIKSVLEDMGFVIGRGPDLLDSTNPASTVIMYASLPTGKHVEVKVNQNGAIYTDFDGYQSDECVRDIDAFKSKLNEGFDINYEVRGEQPNNPDKVKKGERGVPGGSNSRTIAKDGVK